MSGQVLTAFEQDRDRNHTVGLLLMAFWPAASFDQRDGWCDRNVPMGGCEPVAGTGFALDGWEGKSGAG